MIDAPAIKWLHFSYVENIVSTVEAPKMSTKRLSQRVSGASVPHLFVIFAARGHVERARYR